MVLEEGGATGSFFTLGVGAGGDGGSETDAVGLDGAGRVAGGLSVFLVGADVLRESSRAVSEGTFWDGPPEHPMTIVVTKTRQAMKIRIDVVPTGEVVFISSVCVSASGDPG